MRKYPVRCYGCGRYYDPLAEAGGHWHHTGDAGVDRKTLILWIDMLQQERDRALWRASHAPEPDWDAPGALCPECGVPWDQPSPACPRRLFDRHKKGDDHVHTD